MPAIPFRLYGLMVPVLFCSVSFPATALGLTLAEAEQRALARNPVLSATVAAADAAEADARQAGLLPNPELSYNRENLGNDNLTGLDGPASTWILSQRLGLAGQRGARRDSALSEAVAARVRLQHQRDLLLAEVRASWVAVLAAQQRVAFADELGQVALNTHDAVAGQVKAGKVSPVELTRLDVAAAVLQRRSQQAAQSLVVARQKLASLQGLSAPDFGVLPDQLPAVRLLPSPDVIAQASQANPVLKEAEALTRSREAGLQEARASRFPDITLSVGQTQYEDAGEAAWQMGVSVPLPLFDRSQGATQAAHARLIEARAQADAVSQGLQAELNSLYSQVRMLELQLTTFEKTVLPSSEEAFSAISKGYRFGKFGLLDVLDAQRAFIDTRFDYLDTLTEYHRQRNQLDALLGLTQENPL